MRPSGTAMPRIAPVATGVSSPASVAAAAAISRRARSPPAPTMAKRRSTSMVTRSGSAA